MVDGITTFTVFEFGRCYCQVADGIATYSMWIWQMLLPSGRWNCHLGWMTIFGRCYYPGGRWNSHRSIFICLYYFSSEVLSRTSSQMCGRWYLPMFLFRDGSLTLMYIASLMVLIRFWSSFSTILKFSMLILWPVGCYSGHIWGMEPFDVPWTFLQMFWKTLLHILHHILPYHINIYRWPHLFSS